MSALSDADNPGQHAACSVINVGHSSPLGNPFAADWARPDVVVRAYNDLLSMILWLGSQGCAARAEGLPELVANRHGVRLSAGAATFNMARAWSYLVELAAEDRPLLTLDPAGLSSRGDNQNMQLRDCVYRAVQWLREQGTSRSSLSATIVPKAGQWPLSDIFMKWPACTAAELAAFRWPLSSEQEVKDLLAMRHSAPRALVAFEFTGAVREAYEKHWHYTKVALSVDRRDTLIPGPHAKLDARSVMMLTRWEDAFLHPPCTHQVLSDSRAARFKMLDGRAFWGVALFIYSWCIRATRVLLEQPPTLIPDFYLSPTQIVRPCDVGDSDGKRFHFFERGGRVPLSRNPTVEGTSGHGQLHDFPDAEARDRWRSSWARHPKLCEAVVAAVSETAEAAADLVYSEEIERFAGAWYDAGLPVPSDYAAPDAMPALLESQQYQEVRGRGDGRRVPGIIPASRRTELATISLPIRGTPTPHARLTVGEPLSCPPCQHGSRPGWGTHLAPSCSQVQLWRLHLAHTGC